jgi:hypothetical protein
MTAKAIPTVPFIDQGELCALLADLQATGLCLVIGAPDDDGAGRGELLVVRADAHAVTLVPRRLEEVESGDVLHRAMGLALRVDLGPPTNPCNCRDYLNDNGTFTHLYSDGPE